MSHNVSQDLVRVTAFWPALDRSTLIVQRDPQSLSNHAGRTDSSVRHEYVPPMLFKCITERDVLQTLHRRGSQEGKPRSPTSLPQRQVSSSTYISYLSLYLLLKQTIADVIRTCLGPKAMLKMILDQMGGILCVSTRLLP